MQQEGSSAEVWRIEDLFSMADLPGSFGNRGIASTSSAVPGFMAASFYNVNTEMMKGNEEMTLDRALLASKNHREAERRRRERIKSHLDRLRHLLACDPKIDKATLLAKAVEHVRDLQQRAAHIPHADHLPTETDEITVDSHAAADLPPLFHGRRRPVIKASMCCEDRSGLLPELIETLKSLRLRTLRAEIATLGGRVRNVLLVTREDEDGNDDDESVVAEGGDDGSTSFGFIRDALKALVERPVVAAGEGRPKRRRVLDPTPV